MDSADLIHRCQTGDEEGFAALFHQYKNLVYRTAYLMLDDAGEAEDVLQEVFVQVHRSLLTFDPLKGSFTTWLYRVTMNHCLSQRRKRRLPTISLDKVSAAALTEPQSLVNRVEDEEVVRQAVGRLNTKLRTVVILRYYLDLSYAEMAEILNVPTGTVKSRLDRALKTLRQELEMVPCTWPVKEVVK